MWNGEAERLSRLEIDHEIEFCRLFNRNIARLCPRRILSTILARVGIRLRCCSVTHEPAGSYRTRGGEGRR